MTEPLERAVARSGERLQPDFSSVLSELAPALLLHEILLTGAAPGPRRLEHLLDRMLLPLVVQR